MNSNGMMPYQAPEVAGEALPPTLPTSKSSIPKVMGILHIIFGSISLLMALKALTAGKQSEQFVSSMEAQGFDMSAHSQEIQEAMASLDSLAGISSVLGALGALALLVAGIGLVKYKKWGRLTSNVYVLLSALGKVLTVYLYLGPMAVVFDLIVDKSAGGQDLDSGTLKGVIIGAMMVGVLISSAYMIVTLIVVNKKSARESLS